MRVKKAKSRARLALRAIALTAALIAALNIFVGAGYLFPRQAVRSAERRLGLTEPTQTLTRRTLTLRDREGQFRETKRRALLYITSNAQAVGLYTVEPSLAGWIRGRSYCVDCTDAQPEEVCRVDAWLARGEIEDHAAYDGLALYVYGRVYDARVTALRVRLVSGSGTEEYACTLAASELIARTDGTRDVGAARTVAAAPVEKAWYELAEVTIEALDAQGQVLAQSTSPL